MRGAKSLLPVLLVFFLLSSAYAKPAKDCRINDNYYKDRERGWYYFEHCEPKKPDSPKKETKKEPTKKEKEKVVIDWKKIGESSYLDTLTAREFKELMEIAREEVVYKPTHDKMLAYIKMQDYMREKAVNFAYVWRDVLLENPSLDYSVKFPTSNYGAQAYAKIDLQRQAKTMKEIKETVGLFFFVSSLCPYCHEQAKLIRLLEKEHDIAVRTISQDRCDAAFSSCVEEPMMFEVFQVKTTPTLFAVFKDQNNKPKFQPIASGIVTVDEMVNRLVYYYNMFKAGQLAQSQ